jgi:hypothetical protein
MPVCDLYGNLATCCQGLVVSCFVPLHVRENDGGISEDKYIITKTTDHGKKV